MNTGFVDKLKKIKPWHFIWISIMSSELITLILSTVQGRIWWGEVSRETLIIGAVDSLVAPLIVATLVIYFLKQTSEMQQVNERLHEATRKLQALDKMKTDFISVVSHELRTPLTSIKAFIELLLMKPAMPQDRKNKLKTAINAEADRLTRLVNDLLDLSKIESGTIRWRTGEVSIDDILKTAMRFMQPLFESKNLHVSAVHSPDMPLLSGDRGRLVQVVINLLSNAVKFTPQGGSIRVAVRRETHPRDVAVIEIADDGSGINTGDLEVIFERFQRAGDQLTSTVEGSGLGLAIAREIIEYHDGNIWATSIQGKGSTFSFTLPIKAAPSPAVQG